MVQKSIESRNQRFRRGGGVQDFLGESSLRYRQATCVITTNSVESSAGNLTNDVQGDGLTDMGQLNLADDADQENANDEQESQLVAQSPRKRGLLRKLSSAFQRKPMTRYASFDGHRDSLDIVHRQVKEGNIAYRPRVPYPSPSDNSVDNEKSSNSKEENEELRISDIASQQDTRTNIASMPQMLLVREDKGHQKISADSNSTPLPPQLQNDKVGFARSA